MKSESSNLSLNASIGLVKHIPGGHYVKGSRFHPREAPAKGVSVSEFDLAHAQVTVSQYAAFVGGGSYSDKRWWSEGGWDWLNGKDMGWGRVDRSAPEAWPMQTRRPYHPVTGITWHEAQAYCAWLAYQKKQAVRLPSEEEWEYAARGEDGRPFPWGEAFDASLTNTLERGLLDTVEAASNEGDTSPFEVRDMAGNVQEWTASPYTPMPGEVYPSDVLYIARGGSFNDTAFGARTSYRRAYPPGYFYPFLGFRIVVARV